MKQVTEAVEAVTENVNVAVIGVIKRPRENDAYDRLRKDTNSKLSEQLLNIRIRRSKEKKGNISYLDFDAVLHEWMFTGGVHPIAEGYDCIGRRLGEWLRARSTQIQE